jgi:hypothetical protein
MFIVLPVLARIAKSLIKKKKYARIILLKVIAGLFPKTQVRRASFQTEYDEQQSMLWIRNDLVRIRFRNDVVRIRIRMQILSFKLDQLNNW